MVVAVALGSDPGWSLSASEKAARAEIAEWFRISQVAQNLSLALVKYKLRRSREQREWRDVWRNAIKEAKLLAAIE